MNNTTTIVLITISSLSLIASTATLAVVLIGAKQVHIEIEDVKMRTNISIRKIKSALDNLEL